MLVVAACGVGSKDGGFSYGGMFTSTLACIRTDVFRALAPQNGSGSCGQPKKIAFIAIGSTDGTNKSLQSYARTIAKANGCSDPANQGCSCPPEPRRRGYREGRRRPAEGGPVDAGRAAQ